MKIFIARKLSSYSYCTHLVYQMDFHMHEEVHPKREVRREICARCPATSRYALCATGRIGGFSRRTPAARRNLPRIVASEHVRRVRAIASEP